MKYRKLKKLVKLLCKDKFFGIYTRNYIEYIFPKMYKGMMYHTFIIDFDNIHELNASIGYKNVNSSFTMMFSSFLKDRDNVIIGRWFSGDEIIVIIIEDQYEKSLLIFEQFKNHCKLYNFDFKLLLHTDKKIWEIEL